MTIESLQREIGTASDGEARVKTASALEKYLRGLGIVADAWGRGDSVLVDVMGFEAPVTPVAPDKAAGGDWMAVAVSVLGLHERADADELDAWLASDGSWSYEAADIPWCGEFVDTCLKLAGHETGLENPLGARNWLQYGQRTHLPRFGAVVVFWRGRKDGWQGHVGFYAGEDATHYHILGGNQGNRVSVSRIAKSRFLGARWPVGADEPARFVVRPGFNTVNEA